MIISKFAKQLAAVLGCGGLSLMSHGASVDSVPDILQEEMRALNAASKLRTELAIEDEGGITSTPKSGIMFSRSLLAKIQHESNVQQLRGIIRFLLAHEQAHQIQFEKYGVAKMQDKNVEWKRLKECQADLLGAKYLALSYNEKSGNEQEQTDMNDALRDMLEVSFNLGDEERNADHPNRQARRTAARLGAARGQIEQLRLLGDDPTASYMRNHLEVVLDARPNESLLDWSLRQARRIIHYTEEAYHSVALDKQHIEISDESATKGTAKFGLDYTNRGMRPVHVDMEVQCVTASAEDPEDTSRWEKWSVRNYDFTLAPGEHYTVQGELEWQKIGKAVKPRLIVPVLNDTALISCKFED